MIRTSQGQSAEPSGSRMRTKLYPYQALNTSIKLSSEFRLTVTDVTVNFGIQANNRCYNSNLSLGPHPTVPAILKF